jgi:hypothetical protein
MKMIVSYLTNPPSMLIAAVLFVTLIDDTSSVSNRVAIAIANSPSDA